MNATLTRHGYNMREPVPERRHTWRQKVRIVDSNSGAHEFYVEFGEYEDGRLAEVWIVANKVGSFARGILDSLGRSVSLALQSGTSPHDMAEQLRSQDYPPQGTVDAPGSAVTECTSVADYIGREIQSSYGADGRRLGTEV